MRSSYDKSVADELKTCGHRFLEWVPPLSTLLGPLFFNSFKNIDLVNS